MGVKKVKTGKPLTYVSLFSSAGIGCYGFKMEGFDCVATVEILEKRLNIQRHNGKCLHNSGYIGDDITTESSKVKLRAELSKWNICRGGEDLDVLIATPPCQGMSVANHKKGDELHRNSLVIESIRLTQEIQPKFFVYENVRAFLTTKCIDIDGSSKNIREAIEVNLAGCYHINYQVVNFKDYGCPSSRTRTLVIGTRKDLKEITPFNIFPSFSKEQTLRETIGHLSSLKVMGEISSDDIYHNFRPYRPEMRSWIENIGEGQSAFDNIEIERRPHKVVDGLMIPNANKNGDKYTRQYWDKPAPCVHTRNDIMASQSTVHPTDDRVFSIRELMLMMSVPHSFKWTSHSVEDLNNMSEIEKAKFLKREEMNIRHCLGEAVPTVIFNQVAKKIKDFLQNEDYSEKVIKKIIADNKLDDLPNLNLFLKNHLKSYPYSVLSKIAELSNTSRNDNAAYYTRQDICFSVVKDLPDARKYKSLKILEPSIGVGNFLPLLIEKYRIVPKVIIDVVDIDANSLESLKILIESLKVPQNIKINFIHDDFLTHAFKDRYDIVVGNPPFKKLSGDTTLLAQYRSAAYNTETNNLFSFFIEKSISISNVVALVVPKSLISAPEFNKTREILESLHVRKISDYGEAAFKGVKIETVSFIVEKSTRFKKNAKVEIESYITNSVLLKPQDYIFDKNFPYWLLYRDTFFDNIAAKMKFNIFKAFRDRQITKKITSNHGTFRVLKSRNISSNKIIDIKNYDCYVDDISGLAISKYLNEDRAVLIPNLTYSPRACFLPKNTIVDGSVAVLTLRNGSRAITESDLNYFGTKEYERFYAIARNYGTRSLNIDSNSVFFFGILDEEGSGDLNKSEQNQNEVAV